MADDEERYVFLRRLGVEKYAHEDRWWKVGCFPAPVLFALVAFGGRLRWIALLLLIVLGVLCWGLSRWMRWQFFNKIVCPHCGHNPTRRKADGRPRRDPFKMGAQLIELRACPGCGYEGEPLEGESGKRS